jgi:(p)ppGpp synthase/HD superfamily hydrolase
MDGFDTHHTMVRTDFVEGSPLTRDALAFAADRHAGQTRDLDGDVPFVTHPVEVARLLHEAGYADEVVAAGVLHDVLEDTDVEAEELRTRFGDRVAGLVASVSDDPSIENAAEQKAALRRQVAEAGEYAGAIFAADKISKVRELRLRVSQGERSEGDRSKLDHYRASLEMLSGLLPGHDLLEQLRAELEETRSGVGEQRHSELAGESLSSPAHDQVVVPGEHGPG